ncbi:MAG: hypothetical protein R3D25_03155 [Geminicoccaceae bacterium]
MTALRLTATRVTALLGLTATAAAAEPLRLSTPQLDAVTAGALSGAEISVMAAAGFFPLAPKRSISVGNSGYKHRNPECGRLRLQRRLGQRPDRRQAFQPHDAQLVGDLGFFTGETATTGPGTANAGAQAIAEGDFAIPFAVTLPIIPGSGKTFSVTLGVAANNPLPSGGNNGSQQASVGRPPSQGCVARLPGVGLDRRAFEVPPVANLRS